MKIIVIALAVIVALIAIVLVAGAMLPRQHSASRSVVLKHDRQSVYGVVRDFAKHPQWRKDVTQVEILAPAQFREHSKFGVVTYAIDLDEPAKKLVTRIADQNLPYGGSWTYDFEDAPGGTKLTITENGEIKNVAFRFMARYIFGYTSTMEAYLKALEQRMG